MTTAPPPPPKTGPRSGPAWRRLPPPRPFGACFGPAWRRLPPLGPCWHGTRLPGPCGPAPPLRAGGGLFAVRDATGKQKRYAAAHRPPPFGLPPGGLCLAVRSALPPARPLSGASPAACGVTAAPCRFPPRLAGSACRRLPRPAAPPPPPAPLRLAAPPPAGSGGSVPRPSPWSLRSPLPAAGGPPARPPLPAGSLRSLGRCRAVGPPGSAPPAACPPSSLGRLAAWSGSGLRGSRPGLRRPSGPLSSALRPGRGGLGCSAPAGAGIPPPAGGGRGDHLDSWASWRLRVVWPWLSRGLGRGPFRAVSKGIWATPWGYINLTPNIWGLTERGQSCYH